MLPGRGGRRISAGLDSSPENRIPSPDVFRNIKEIFEYSDVADVTKKTYVSISLNPDIRGSDLLATSHWLVAWRNGVFYLSSVKKILQ